MEEWEEGKGRREWGEQVYQRRIMKDNNLWPVQTFTSWYMIS